MCVREKGNDEGEVNMPIYSQGRGAIYDNTVVSKELSLLSGI